MGKVYTLCCYMRSTTLRVDSKSPIQSWVNNTPVAAFSSENKADLARKRFLAYWLYELIDYIKESGFVYKYTDHGNSFDISYGSQAFLDEHGAFSFGVHIAANLISAELNDDWDGYTEIFDEGE